MPHIAGPQIFPLWYVLYLILVSFSSSELLSAVDRHLAIGENIHIAPLVVAPIPILSTVVLSPIYRAFDNASIPNIPNGDRQLRRKILDASAYRSSEGYAFRL